MKENYIIDTNKNASELLKILNNKSYTKTQKKEKLIENFNYAKEDKTVLANVILAIVGSPFDINKIFKAEINAEKISFAKEIENEDEIQSVLDEEFEIYDSLKKIYSYNTLQDILKGREYISEAFIDKYEKYKQDLKLLKSIYKEYFKSEYNSMFRKYKENNYVAYTGKNNGKSNQKCNEEEFFKNLKKQINNLPDSCKEKQYILSELEENNFLRKLNITENGQIPYQIHKKELERILENQSKYYKSINENKEKIIRILTFRIPYYIGPLAKEKGKWAWIVRKNDEKILPWKNIEEIIDEDATAEAFITKMTKKCTYLINENVIPRQSILYSKFCVLNELNNIKINNHHIRKDLKRKILEELFYQKNKVTKKALEDFYRKEMLTETVQIKGLSNETEFNSNMSSYIHLKKIFGKIDETNIKMCEDLIYWITIFEEKKILRKKIKKEYPEIEENQLNQICKLKYTGWSSLSRKLLVEIKAYDGENIMQKLEKTSMNFMQIISEKEFGIGKKIEELLPKKMGKVKYEDVEEIPTSPANKRAIWQCICIAKEIVKIMKGEPTNIYIEFARGEEKKEAKDNRIKQLLKKYEAIEKQNNYLKEYDPEVYKELKKNQNDRTLNEKMFLYYLQCGKCLYSGKRLDLNNLNVYEIDHIIPRTYIKDDSIDNKALVLRQENQRKRDNLLLSEEIIRAREAWWKSLHDNGLMNDKKFYNLTRRKMFETNDDINKFIQRQLVETRQIIKHVTNLLIAEYKDTNIFSIKARLTSQFRDEFKIYKNREVNNYHHAHDAYILSIIGNAIDNNFRYKDEYIYSEYVKKYLSNTITGKAKQNIIMNCIKKDLDMEKVKKVFEYKDCFISRKLEEDTGKFYKQTIYSPNDKTVHPEIKLKENRDAKKYGGYTGENKAYYTIFSYKNSKGKAELFMIGVPIKIRYDIQSGKTSLENYIQNAFMKEKGYTDLKIIKKRVLKYQEYLDENNEPMILCSDKEFRASKELIVNNKMTELIYFMNLKQSELTDEEMQRVISNFDYMYDYFLQKLEREYKVFDSTLQKLKEKRELFQKISFEDKKSTINGMIDLMQKGQGNLSKIGLGDREGRRRGEKTFAANKLINMIFIDKSVTGMYERRRKINGVENSCN